MLVKAVPQVGARHGETVCCAGVTRDHQWRRLYPVRFRHLDETNKFKRWQWLRYASRAPTNDRRTESRHVFEDKLQPLNSMRQGERAEFLERLIMPSARHAADEGHSLTIVRPIDYRFSIRPMKQGEHDALCRSYQKSTAQGSLLDQELKAFVPPQCHFRLRFTDADGTHSHQCGDWETIAAFTKWKRKYGAEKAARYLSDKYNDEYRENGVVFALGTIQKRPRQWALLGIIRANKLDQGTLF